MSEYYTKEAEEFAQFFTIKIQHEDKTVNNRRIMIDGMRRHDPGTLKLLLTDPARIWTLQEIRELEGW